MTTADAPRILVVEDEHDVAQGYEIWLHDDYDVEIAVNGTEALDRIDADIDVVLLDRMMPDLSGEDVLREIRDRGVDCRVVMVTAVEPDFDIVEMGFDAYITKPPERDELVATVDRLLGRADVSEEMQEYYSLEARRGALEAQKTREELAENDAYQDLLDRIDRAEAGVDEGLGDLSEDIDFVSAVRELEDDSGNYEAGTATDEADTATDEADSTSGAVQPEDDEEGTR